MRITEADSIKATAYQNGHYVDSIYDSGFNSVDDVIAFMRRRASTRDIDQVIIVKFETEEVANYKVFTNSFKKS